jgi:hypothetical protein
VSVSGVKYVNDVDGDNSYTNKLIYCTETCDSSARPDYTAQNKQTQTTRWRAEFTTLSPGHPEITQNKYVVWYLMSETNM